MFPTLILLKASMNLGYPILCHPSQKRCYWAQDGQEVNTGLGIDLRIMGSAAINLNNDVLYIAGGFGFTGALNSTEIHAFQEKPKIGPEMPFPTSDHCLVQIGSDEFMLVGFDKSANENRYFIYDLSTEKWNEELEDGPRSGSWYSQQYCKAFKVGEKVKVFRSGYAYKSFIFDVSSKKWENGMSFFHISNVSFIPFFVFGFWSLLAPKLQKYNVIFVYILQGKMGKTEKKGKEITKLK